MKVPPEAYGLGQRNKKVGGPVGQKKKRRRELVFFNTIVKENDPSLITDEPGAVC